jgi:hypothetical protein
VQLAAAWPSLLTEVKKVLLEFNCEAVILQLLDNSIYLAKSDDGSLLLLSKEMMVNTTWQVI